MAGKKRGLGRGLDALLTGNVASNSSGTASKQASEQGDLKTLPVHKLQRGVYQPRSHMDEASLHELADSIKAQGVVQPIVVRPVGGGQYEIIAGERRWRASQIAGLQEIPAIVRDVPDRTAIAVALIENIQRENLNPLEESLALARLIEEFELTHQEAADAVGRSRTAVSNMLRLLDLSENVKTMVAERILEMGHARALLSLNEDLQLKAAKEIEKKDLSVRATEALVKKLLVDPKPKAEKWADPNLTSLQTKLSDTLGAKVKIDHKQNGKGKLVVEYNSLDELDGILGHIQ